MTSNRVLIFDTTLRDGEQSPGATMTSEEKLEVARALGRLGVDIIEAGFPAASPDDLAAVKRILLVTQPELFGMELVRVTIPSTRLVTTPPSTYSASSPSAWVTKLNR